MTYRGTVKNGVIVLDEGLSLPEGTAVHVEPTPATASPPSSSPAATLLKYAGKAKGLPPDASRNHDHYLYGTKKR